MSILRSTLIGICNGCRSFRDSQSREIENHLRPWRESAPDALRERGAEIGIAYLDRMFDGLREAVLLGRREARIPLVDTKTDDVSVETAAGVWHGIASHLTDIGLTCGRDWTWHDEGRRSGIVTLIVQL